MDLVGKAIKNGRIGELEILIHLDQEGSFRELSLVCILSRLLIFYIMLIIYVN